MAANLAPVEVLALFDELSEQPEILLAGTRVGIVDATVFVEQLIEKLVAEAVLDRLLIGLEDTLVKRRRASPEAAQQAGANLPLRTPEGRAEHVHLPAG